MFAALLLPRGVELQLGTIMVNPLRILLTGLALGAARRLAERQVRLAISLADGLLIAHVCIIVISALAHGGLDEGLENATASVIDMGLAYFVARAAVHDVASYRYFVRVMLIIAAISGVFGLVEMMGGYSVIRGVFQPFFPRVPYVYLENQRLGLYRATATFPADILFGLYCTLAIGLAVCIGARNLGMRPGLYRTAVTLSLVGVFSSLSSAPWLACGLIVMILAYDRFLRKVRHRLRLLLFSSAAAFVVLGVISNRGPLRLLVDYLTLNPESGYVRMAMLECVWALVPDYWALGWGWGNDWPRIVEWYKWNSIDCFYAVLFVRSGVFAVLSFLAFLFYSWYGIGRASRYAPSIANDAKGWTVTTACFAVAVFSVDVFGNFVVPVYALLGAGQVLMLPTSRFGRGER
ncbi:MAG: hypothetical protein AABZ12_00470 [Planctomycetota bacterium]